MSVRTITFGKITWTNIENPTTKDSHLWHERDAARPKLSLGLPRYPGYRGPRRRGDAHILRKEQLALKEARP